MLKLNNQIENLVLVDANAYVHRSFHAYEPKLDRKNKDQRVLHGLLDVLTDLSYKLPKIDNILFVFDPVNGSDYRKSIYSFYKDNRKEKDPDLVRQQEDAKMILGKKLGLPIMCYSGYEADDAIGSLSHMYKKEYQIIMVSPDKDMAQIVEERNILQMKKVKKNGVKKYLLMDEADVKEDYGVSPRQIPDLLALTGDEVDNLPGIDGIGQKTAAKILAKYQSIEHLLAIAHEIENPNLKTKIMEAKDSLLVVKKLATVVTDLRLEQDLKKSIEISKLVREHKDYGNNLNNLMSYFNWPEHYRELLV